MASKREQICAGVFALIVAACPDIEPTRNQDKPGEEDDADAVNLLDGSLELLGIDLSPLTYNYDHALSVEVLAAPTVDLTKEEALDARMRLIGLAVDADRSLGGLVDFLRVEAPDTDNADLYGAPTVRFGEFKIVATYATQNPLT